MNEKVRREETVLVRDGFVYGHRHFASRNRFHFFFTFLGNESIKKINFEEYVELFTCYIRHCHGARSLSQHNMSQIFLDNVGAAVKSLFSLRFTSIQFTRHFSQPLFSIKI